MPLGAVRLVVPKLFAVKVVSTEEFLNQNPGNLGLFLPRSEFKRKHFVENYIQSVFDAFGEKKIAGSKIAIGTDGSRLALSIARQILRLAAGNAISRVITGVGGFLSAPALSVVLRERGTVLGFYLASDGGRREGGVYDEDGEEGEEEEEVEEEEEQDRNPNENKSRTGEEKFVLQTFAGNGGLTSHAFNKEIFKQSRYITKYRISIPAPDPDEANTFEYPGVREIFVEGRSFKVEIIEPLGAYVNVLNDHFDLNLLRLWAKRFPKRVVVGVGGGRMNSYVKKIFGELIGLKSSSFVDCKGAWKGMDRVGDVEEICRTLRAGEWDFGFSLSPDGRRYALFDSGGHLINPGTVLALVADKAVAYLPGLQKPEEANRRSENSAALTTTTTTPTTTVRTSAGSAQSAAATLADAATAKRPTVTSATPPPPKGFARTATTSRAVDAVAAKMGVEMHVTPPEWRHLDALLDAGRVAIFGDDSFQMGSFHARVPDGIWAALAVMSVIAVAEAEEGGADMNQEEIIQDEESAEEEEVVSKLTLSEESSKETAPPPKTRPVNPLVIATEFYHSLAEGVLTPAPDRVLNPVRVLARRHWDEFGRHLCVRMDYLDLNQKDALSMFEKLQIKIRSPIIFVHAWFHYGPHSYQVIHGEEFQYVDPVDISATMTTNCIRIFLHDGSIIAFRLCHAEDGVNFRIFVDKFEDSSFLSAYSRDATLLPLVKIAEEMCQVRVFTGKQVPDTRF